MRLLTLRTSASGGARLSEVTRTVVCLDLACSLIGVPFNKVSFGSYDLVFIQLDSKAYLSLQEEAIRLAGVTKKVYSNGYYTIEKILELSAPPSINSICVQLGVGEVGDFAAKLLDKYIYLLPSFVE